MEVVEISISPDLKGKHVLKITASNPQSHSGEDSESFRIGKKRMLGFLASFPFKGIINFF